MDEKSFGEVSREKVNPMAEFMGKSTEVNVGEDKEGLVNLRVSLSVDNRDPKEWGSHPVRLSISGGVYSHSLSQGNFIDLSGVKEVGISLGGALGGAIRAAVEKIDSRQKGYLQTSRL